MPTSLVTQAVASSDKKSIHLKIIAAEASTEARPGKSRFQRPDACLTETIATSETHVSLYWVPG